jgi:hypothetical protein
VFAAKSHDNQSTLTNVDKAPSASTKETIPRDVRLLDISYIFRSFCADKIEEQDYINWLVKSNTLNEGQEQIFQVVSP